MKFNFKEFKRHEIVDPSESSSSSRSYIQTISVVDKRLKLITLWNLDTFEYKLSLLRDIYNRYMEEGSIASSISSQSEANGFLTDSMDEWQTLQSFNQNDSFSPRV
jgi:hypothetical protein